MPYFKSRANYRLETATREIAGKKPRLLALESRRALLEKSANAFAAISGRKAFHLLLDFHIQERHELLFVAAEQRLLYRANRNRRALRDFLRERAHFALQLRQRHHA